jgi:hypothetical protein
MEYMNLLKKKFEKKKKNIEISNCLAQPIISQSLWKLIYLVIRE